MPHATRERHIAVVDRRVKVATLAGASDWEMMPRGAEGTCHRMSCSSHSNPTGSTIAHVGKECRIQQVSRKNKAKYRQGHQCAVCSARFADLGIDEQPLFVS